MTLPPMPRIAKIGGILTACVTRAELARIMVNDALAARAGQLARPRVIVASNGSVIAGYHRQPAFRTLIDQADLIDPDGMSLVLTTKLLWRQPLDERVATTDFIVDACEAAERAGLRFFFLGGRPGIAARAAAELRGRYPGLQIVGARHGYFDDGEISEICAEIRASGADVLWLGLGSPRQEAFAIANRDELAGLAWIRTCGGLFDHLGAGVRRAPLWLQNAGLEWLHRAILEPRRLGGRYLVTNPAALFHLMTKSRE